MFVKPIKMDEILASAFPIKVRVSPRARKMSLRLCADHSGFILTMPARASMKSARRFVESSSGWLTANSCFLSVKKKFADGCSFSFMGQELFLCHVKDAKRGVWQEENIIYVSGSSEFLDRRTKEYLHKKFLCHIKERVNFYVSKINKKVSKVTVRDNTSRWGSCSCNASVSFNFYLGYAPESIIDYVVAHEICHLLEMNHSVRFWREVAKLYPEYKQARIWLKANGANLYDFS